MALKSQLWLVGLFTIFQWRKGCEAQLRLCVFNANDIISFLEAGKVGNFVVYFVSQLLDFATLYAEEIKVFLLSRTNVRSNSGT